MQDNELKYWVTLVTDLRIGAKTLLKLNKRFKNLGEIFERSFDWMEKINLGNEAKKAIMEVVRSKKPEVELEKVKKLGLSVVTIKDKNYPKMLSEIPDPPALLYIKGEIKPEDELAIGVVGSRKYTDYGARVTQDITRELAQNKLTIISGLALGIDAIAHKTALDHHTRTIGVLGCGLDKIYPSSNRYLAERILSGNGAIISEYPPGTPPLKHHFPVRNRIISGLSMGIVVIEAAQKSGTLLTAKSALDYNREVFAVPGSIYSSTSEGSHNLIKYGAKLITFGEDIIKELNLERKTHQVQAKKIIPDNKEEAIVLKELNRDKPIHVDKLVKLTGFEISKLNATLIMMEMKGKVRNLGNSQYVLG